MFPRPACGLAVLLGMTGYAAAQPTSPLWPTRQASDRPADTTADRPGLLPPTAVVSTDPPAATRPGRPAAVVAGPLPGPIPGVDTARTARLACPVGAAADTAPAPKPVTTAPTPAPTTTTLAPHMPTAGQMTGACGPAGDACDHGRGCGPDGRVWVGFEWLYWITSGQGVPALVTSAPAGTPQAVAGVLGQGATGTLFGGRRSNNNFRNGFRVTAGTWLNDDRTLGLEADFFFLGNSKGGFTSTPGIATIVTRPFTNVGAGLPGFADAERVNDPGLRGAVGATTQNTFLGAGVNALYNLSGDPAGRLDLLVGYRYLNLTDDVTVRENLSVLPVAAGLPFASGVPAGTNFLIEDRFRTRNNFHGGLIGLSGERRFGDFFVGGRAAVSLGANIQTVDIDGVTTITPPGGTGTTFGGGLLTQPTNIGRYERTVFAVVPEVGVRAGVQLTEFARAYVGYNFLYLSNVVRAGDQIDTRVNPALLPPRTLPVPGPALPAFGFRQTDFWVHGINAGLEVRF